jgi:hypothetical protein
MNYQLHYDLLINRAISENRKKLKRTDEQYIYYEKHHIIPKCMVGSDEKKNLVLLSGREHFIAHKLLAKQHKNTKYYGSLMCAIRLMCVCKSKHNISNNRMFEKMRINFSILQSEKFKGKALKKESIEKRTATRIENGSYITTDNCRLLRKENRAKQTEMHNVKICMFGINYISIKDARADLNCGRKFIINRLKSDKFPTCYYL